MGNQPPVERIEDVRDHQRREDVLDERKGNDEDGKRGDRDTDQQKRLGTIHANLYRTDDKKATDRRREPENYTKV